MRIQKIDNTAPAFNRKPNAQEMKVYTNSLNQGLDLLGKQVDLILHNASAPAVKSENTGIGSLFSRTVITKLFPFLKEHGFKGIQQEPNGLRKVLDNSPYAPEAKAKNIYMIPLEKLASDEYGNILSKKTFETIVKNNPNTSEVNYPYVRSMYEVALREAYTNGKDSKEFANFKETRESEYEQSAIYRILSKIKGNDNFKIWSQKDNYTEDEIAQLAKAAEIKNWDKIDQQLFVNPNSEKSKARIAELKEKYKDDYDYYLFQQMLLEKENEASNKLSEKTGIKIIGDSPVAPTAVESWVNQKLFLKGKSIGCPPDYFSKTGQRWGFPYYDPEKIFNKDGSLGEAGKIMQQKYEEYFASFPGGIRIDHIIGLIDPFIYTNSSKKMTASNSGRIYSIFSGKYKKKNDDEYANILTKIIIPAAKKHGLSKDAIICEDLGDRNLPTERVMKKLGLSGISVTQFDHRGAKAPERNLIMPGSHDNQSFLEFVEDLFNFGNDKDKKARFLKKTKYLAEDTAPKGAAKEEVKQYLKDIRTNKSKFIAASFAELFTSPAKRVQIFFADFWGLGKTYNRPGTTTGNWALRLEETFEDDYYKAVPQGKAPNFADAVSTALKQRGLDKGNEQLIKDLDASAKILNEA